MECNLTCILELLDRFNNEPTPARLATNKPQIDIDKGREMKYDEVLALCASFCCHVKDLQDPSHPRHRWVTSAAVLENAGVILVLESHQLIFFYFYPHRSVHLLCTRLPFHLSPMLGKPASWL